jgi:Zn-dependent peptidase ImmA (M78 family)/transcriptional regulator with XRE-family HTH domain
VIGERIRLAREACRMTQAELASAAELSQAAISELEAGRLADPAKATVDRIAQATSFPVSFFHRGPLPDFPEGRYRRLQRGSSKVDKQVRALSRQIVEVVERSEKQLRLPPVALDPVRDANPLSGEAIEALADRSRRAFGIGERDPIPNISRAAERAGIIVVRLPNYALDHDGFSAWPDYGLDGRPLIAVVGGKSGDRDRFTVAHELGHLLLHTARPVADPKDAEREANRFAGALLVSRAAANDAIRAPITLRVLMNVKARYGMSIAAIARRAYDLGLITKDQYGSLMRQLSARKWRHMEPIDVEPERPILIGKILAALSGSGSTSERAERIGMQPFTFNALAAS